MMTCAIIIPVYKTEITNDEYISLRKCLEILGHYPVIFVTPQSLDCIIYEKECSIFNVRFNRVSFKDEFFYGVDGYNRLLLSKSFYQAFYEYKYILIYQLDAYVFCDELAKWCEKGYDFIGAPLIGSFSDTSFSTIMRVGNGGFSLRNVQTALRFFQSKKNVFTPKQAAKYISLWKKPYTRLLVWVLMIFGWRNKPDYVAKKWNYNEDDFWSGLLDNSRFALIKPSPEEAMQFSFERFPANLYKLCGEKLPFGCHAWRKYQCDEFWNQFINN